MLKIPAFSLPTFLGLALVLTGVLAVMVWGNPAPWGSTEYLRIAESRWISVIVITLVATAQALATVLFHTITENRILTPSILGFDAMYVLIHTILVVIWGASSAKFEGVPLLIMQCVVMVGSASFTTIWLLIRVRAHLHVLLLLGAAFGIGCGSLSNFLQRILSPSEFDMLAARLFGNLSNADVGFLPYATCAVGVCAWYTWKKRHTYDVLAAGRTTASSLGVAVTREIVVAIVVVAVLVSVSVSLVGPMTFYGFLIATLAYQWAPKDRYANVLPLAIIIGLVALLGATIILKNVWSAGGFVTVIIEIIGGSLFLIVLIRRGLS